MEESSKLLLQNNNVLFAPSQPPITTPFPTPSTPPNFQKGTTIAPSAPRKSNLELMMENFIATQTQQNKEFMNQNVHTSEW